MLLFRSEEHVERWCQVWRLSRGALLSPAQAWGLAQAWYGPDRRDPSWRRHSRDETERLLRELDLVGPFWRLE